VYPVSCPDLSSCVNPDTSALSQVTRLTCLVEARINPAGVGLQVAQNQCEGLLLADSTRSRMPASRILIRPQTNVGNRRPRVNPGPAPDDTSQRGTAWRLGTTAARRVIDV
jgi:hypothetical protein